MGIQAADNCRASKPAIVARDCPAPRLPEKPIGTPSLQPLLPVEICMYRAELAVVSPILHAVGAPRPNHWFIRTEDFVRGMQAKGGLYPFAPTQVKDQAADIKPGSWCVDPTAVNPRWTNEDPACLDRVFSLGKNLGRWTPYANDCHDAVQDAMNQCSRSDDLMSTQQIEPVTEQDLSGLENAVHRLSGR